MSDYEQLDGEKDLPLFKRRWAFLLCIAVLQFFEGISFASYGQISNFYVQFFKSSHAIVDWITNARNISALFVPFPLTWFLFRRSIGPRTVILITALASTVGLFLVTISLTHRSLIVLAVLGQITCGLIESVGITIPSTFAALWFPEHQVGTAIAVNVIGIYFGGGVGFILPPILLVSSSNRINATEPLTEKQLEAGQYSLLALYGSFLAISTLVSVILFFFVTDKPPTPPTMAQAAKTVDTPRGSFQDFLDHLKLLFANRDYVLCCITLGLVFQLSLPEVLMMAEIVLKIFNHSSLQPNILSGLALCTYSIGGILGAIIVGKAVDKFKNYRIMSIIGAGSVMLSTVGIALGVVYRSSAVLFVSNFFFGYFSATTEVVLLEIATQLTYPVDETIVNTWLTGILSVIGLLIGIIGRSLFTTFKTNGLLVFQSVCGFVGLLLVCVISPRNRRLEAQENPKHINDCEYE